MSTLIRLPDVLSAYGAKRPTLYAHMADGLFPRPVKLGAKFAAWPMDEVTAVINARIAGKTPDQIKVLVAELVAARQRRA
ncbi:helix-turn-helix transcriptional regulator [Pseudochelatococcus lubricantis]|uniref:helix-turn-helix transcriptional regulator n=1 Tax=Pseudochelatococcus lubricantis TaxID=1538102 RepID=UPI0035E787A6